jgi:signal recognition particle receptor subunit beta
MSVSRKHYTASLSQTQNRTGWSIIFRHPARHDDSTGKPGKRIRRGLGTRDEPEAIALRDQLNELLAEPRFWDPTACPEATEHFDKRVVDIFYHGMMPEQHDYFGVRDALIPLPDSETSDYRRALFLGTTGAGKTTLIRQLIGTDPEHERFPSTSTAKTTVADTEVVMADGPFRAAVTFVSGDELREYLKECVSAAILAAYRGEEDKEVLRKLLNHVSQRFRFNYVLGNGPIKLVSDFDDDDDENEDQEGEGEEEILMAPENLEAVDLEATNALLTALLEQIRKVSTDRGNDLRKDLEAADESDKRVVDELFEDDLDELLRGDEAFHSIVDQLMDEIEKRFDALNSGIVQRTRQGWPLSWFWETDDRKAFIRAISLFSSNYAKLFGYLLTPLVNGIRVSGPLFPTWVSNSSPKLVLLDGEGLGHTAKSSAALSTTTTRRIEEVDAVVLVDNATQPMQAAPVAAMKQIVSTGNASKLLIAFTHFDGVKGDNLPTPSSRAQHILASAENVLSSIGEELGSFAERALRQRLSNECFFLAQIDIVLTSAKKSGKRTIAQLNCLIEAINQIVERPEPAAARPQYDKVNLVLAIKAAVESFHEAWLSILGIKLKPGISKEHWTRVKALTRRLATSGWADEYDTLKPVADLRQQLQTRIYVALQNPLTWDGGEPSDDGKQQIFDDLADRISKKLVDLSTRRIRKERVADWQSAYNERGRGSTFVRAKIIVEDIYNRAAPVPDIIPSPERNRFLHEVMDTIQSVADEVGTVLK